MARTALNIISDGTARRIASEWHSGGGSPLYALASTGAIDTARHDHSAESEIVDALDSDMSNDDRYELTALLTYVEFHGTRKPVPGWSTMPWESGFA